MTEREGGRYCSKQEEANYERKSLKYPADSIYHLCINRILLYHTTRSEIVESNLMKESRKDRMEEKQGRIHGNPVADGWAGAVMRKPLGIQKCDGRTDEPTYRLPTDTARCRVACPRLKRRKRRRKRIRGTRPSRPIRCDVWIVEQMRYRPTNRRTEPVIEVLCRT